MKERVKPPRKGVYILPNLVTATSMFSAFLGITWAISGKLEMCAVAIIVSAVCDGLDGKVARLTGTSSDFGVQFDSLADLVAFGVTPALMVYIWQLNNFGRLGIITAFIFVACGALRLARFNVQPPGSSKKFFTGLPIPAAGCTLSALVLFQGYSPAGLANFMGWFTLVTTFSLALLMVSNIRYASMKDAGLVKAHPFPSLVTALLLFALLASRPKLLGFPIMFAYLLSGPLYTGLVLSRRSSKLLRESHKELS